VRNMQGCRAFTESDAPCRRPGVVLSEQGFPHHGRVWVKKLVHRTDSKINSGIEHKIDIKNNRRYHRRRLIRKDQVWYLECWITYRKINGACGYLGKEKGEY